MQAWRVCCIRCASVHLWIFVVVALVEGANVATLRPTAEIASIKYSTFGQLVRAKISICHLLMLLCLFSLCFFYEFVLRKSWILFEFCCLGNNQRFIMWNFRKKYFTFSFRFPFWRPRDFAEIFEYISTYISICIYRSLYLFAFCFVCYVFFYILHQM